MNPLAANAPRPANQTPSTARRIEGGSAQAWKGIAFDIPKNWQATPKDDALLVMPAGANAAGILEEVYVMTAADPRARVTALR